MSMYNDNILDSIFGYILDPYSHDFYQYYSSHYPPLFQKIIQEWFVDLENQDTERQRLKNIHWKKMMEQQNKNSNNGAHMYNYSFHLEEHQPSSSQYTFCECGYSYYYPGYSRIETIDLVLNLQGSVFETYQPNSSGHDKKINYKRKAMALDYHRDFRFVLGNKKDKPILWDHNIRGINACIWFYLSNLDDLSTQFIEEFKDQLSWHHLSSKRKFTLSEINKFRNYLCWEQFPHTEYYHKYGFCPCYQTIDKAGINNKLDIGWHPRWHISCPIKLNIHLKMIQEMKEYWENKKIVKNIWYQIIDALWNGINLRN